jgi:hypothetical protein
MQENKNLVEEALIQMKNVEEAIAENAKGILASTMKEEINQLVKESLSEQEEVDVDAEMEMPASDEEEMDIEMDAEDDDMEGEMEMELDMDSDETPIDLTGASDEEILKVFKAMSEEDGIIVTKDDEEIQLTDNDSDNEYIIKLGESKTKSNVNEESSDLDAIVADLFKNSDDEVDTEMDVEMDSEMEPEMEGEEVMYEITLDEESDEDLDEQEEEDESMLDEESDMDEQAEEEDESMLDEESDEDLDEQIEEDESMLDEESDMDEQAEEEDESMLDEESDDDNLDEAYNHKKAMKPKGVGIGKGPKFSYKSSGKGGFKEDMKQGKATMGTGKAKFEYKKGANMEGKSKIVKAETKEGWGSKKHEYKRKKVDGVEKKAGDVKGHYKDYEKTETKEAARTYAMGSKEGRGNRKAISNNRNYLYTDNGVKVESLEAEVSMLREKNEEYRKALNLFREKLNEVAIFNSNLAYATRLFTEHSTTKKEKINILRRFDSVETLKESKGLYKSIKEELSQGETKSITESVENKLNTTVTSGSAINLIESKTYENPQFMRMKDLMSKIK